MSSQDTYVCRARLAAKTLLMLSRQIPPQAPTQVGESHKCKPIRVMHQCARRCLPIMTRFERYLQAHKTMYRPHRWQLAMPLCTSLSRPI